MLASGANTPFFLSDQTYYEVINAPVSNNAYYILAQQYIAAELNFLQGADPSDAQAAFDAATALFNTYVPADIAGLKKSNSLRSQFVDLAYTLEQYNTGMIGPGYCEYYSMVDLKGASIDIDDNESFDNDISYYPNPVNDVLNIVSNKNFRINIFSSTGRLVVDRENEKSIDMSHLESGLYLIRIETGEKTVTGKLTKY
jgi:hypothetical protein